MEIDKYIKIGTGLSYTFISYGALKHVIKNYRDDKCTKSNLVIGLNSAIATGLLYLYSELRR